MNIDDMLIWKSEGAKHIQALCHKIVAELGWELVESEPMIWVLTENGSHILTVEVKNGITVKTIFSSIPFSYKEIEDCKSGVTQEVEKKCRAELGKLGNK